MRLLIWALDPRRAPLILAGLALPAALLLAARAVERALDRTAGAA